MNGTLFKYFLKSQLKAMVLIAAVVICFVFVFTCADMMRRVTAAVESPVLICGYLSLLRIPYTCCNLFGYMYFIAATFSLWNLSQTNEITILKSIGKSPKQILFPFFFLSVLIGISYVFVVHPLSVRIDRFADYQDKAYLSKSTLYSRNLWMKDANNNVFIGQLSRDSMKCLLIRDVVTRDEMFADSVDIVGNQWLLKTGYSRANGVNTVFSEKLIRAPIGNEELEMYSIPPQKCGIYTLLRCLASEKSFVTDLSGYMINLNKVLSTGIVFLLFSIIAAIICLPINRYKTKTYVSSSVVCSAIGLHLFNNICGSMGRSGSLSPIICSWLPTIVALSLSIALLIWKEE